MKSLIEMRQLMFLTNVYSVYYETPLRAALFFFLFPGSPVRGSWMWFELQVDLKSAARFACAPKAEMELHY